MDDFLLNKQEDVFFRMQSRKPSRKNKRPAQLARQSVNEQDAQINFDELLEENTQDYYESRNRTEQVIRRR